MFFGHREATYQLIKQIFTWTICRNFFKKFIISCILHSSGLKKEIVYCNNELHPFGTLERHECVSTFCLLGKSVQQLLKMALFSDFNPLMDICHLLELLYL